MYDLEDLDGYLSARCAPSMYGGRPKNVKNFAVRAASKGKTPPLTTAACSLSTNASRFMLPPPRLLYQPTHHCTQWKTRERIPSRANRARRRNAVPTLTTLLPQQLIITTRHCTSRTRDVMDLSTHIDLSLIHI